MTAPAAILPAAPSPGFLRFFRWYARRLLSKAFHAVRLVRESAPALAAAADHDGPLIVLLSHSAWWDPILGVFVGEKFFPRHTGIAPMDTTSLRKFAFFRRVGIFGIDPDHLSAMHDMQRYVSTYFAATTRPALYLTPQGRFSDPREEITLRPGAAAIAAGHPTVRVIALAIEYAFWLDQRPEAFLRAVEVIPEAATDTPISTPHWHRAMREAMSDNRDQLAKLVIARDPAPFDTLLGGAVRINPIYDLYLTLRGRSNAVSQSHRRQHPATPAQSPPAHTPHA